MKPADEQLADATIDPRLTAAVTLIGRTGAEELQIRYCEEEDPVVWVAAALWQGTWECGASVDPVQAVFRLCDQVIDGGTCTHCGRPTGFAPNFDLAEDLWPEAVCWFHWRPDRDEFVRSCA